jgi:hypothetical protein
MEPAEKFAAAIFNFRLSLIVKGTDKQVGI